MTAITHQRRQPLHGPALAHKTHIYRSCPGRGHRLPGRRPRRHRPRSAPADRPRRREASEGRGAPAPGRELPRGDSHRGPQAPHRAPRRAAQAAPRSLRDPPRRRLAGDPRLDRRLRVRRRPDGGLLRRHLPRQVPVRLRHLGLGRRPRRPGRRSRGRAGLPRGACSTRSRAPAPGPSAADEHRRGTSGHSDPSGRDDARRGERRGDAFPLPDAGGPAAPQAAQGGDRRGAGARADARQSQARGVPRGGQRGRAGARPGGTWPRSTPSGWGCRTTPGSTCRSCSTSPCGCCGCWSKPGWSRRLSPTMG